MTTCKAMKDAINKRLDARQSIDQISKELCGDLKYSRTKVINIARKERGEQFLIDNADWLGYDGVGQLKSPKLKKILVTENLRQPTSEEYDKWNEVLESEKNELQNLLNEMSQTNIKNFSSVLRSLKNKIHAIKNDLLLLKNNVVEDQVNTVDDKVNTLNDQSLKVKDFKKIFKLVFADGIVKELLIRKDGTISAMASDFTGDTMLIKLKYKNLTLPEDIAIANCEEFKKFVSRFSNETPIEINENNFILNDLTRKAEYPRVRVDEIRKQKEFPDIQFDITIPDVPVDTLKEAIKNKTASLEGHYLFAIEDGILKIRVGEIEDKYNQKGIITQSIMKVNTDKTLSSMFLINIAEVINSLEENPTISMGNNIPLKMDVETDTYSISYLFAPRAPKPEIVETPVVETPITTDIPVTDSPIMATTATDSPVTDTQVTESQDS